IDPWDEPFPFPTQNLQTFLMQKYSPSKKPKNQGGTWAIRIDDEKPTDVHRHFCMISVTIAAPTDDTLLLELENTPLTYDLEKFVSREGGECLSDGQQSTIRLPLTTRNSKT